MADAFLHAVVTWLAVAAGLIGIALTALMFLVRERFRGGVLGRGFGVWVLALFLWAFALLQKGVMDLVVVSPFTGLIHMLIMIAGLVAALAGAYAIYGVAAR
jgi:hypothetical protein